MIIRQAEISDKEDLLKLVKNFYSKSSPETVRKWKGEYPLLIKGTFVVEDRGKLVAYTCFWFKGDVLYIGDLYVASKYRRKGVATNLLNILERIQKQSGKKFMEVDVRIKDKKAVKFYEKRGFRFWSMKGGGSLKLRK